MIINRQAAIEALCDQCGSYTDEQCKTHSEFWCESGARMRKLPPAEPEMKMNNSSERYYKGSSLRKDKKK